MNTFYSPILFTDTIVFYSMCLVLPCIFTLFGYKYNLFSYVANFFIKKNQSFFCSNNKKESKENIELIINNLFQNVSSYEAFYNYYTRDYRPNKQYEANILPYIENILLVLESNEYLLSLLDIKMLLNSNVSIKLMDFYKQSQQHFSKLKHWKECINTYNLPFDKEIDFFKKFGVPHLKTSEDRKSSSNTIDIYRDFSDFMIKDYVPKIQELAVKAKELINILTSKHIA